MSGEWRIVKQQTLVTSYDVVEDEEGTDEEMQGRLADGWIDDPHHFIHHFAGNTEITTALDGKKFNTREEARDAQREHKLR